MPAYNGYSAWGWDGANGMRGECVASIDYVDDDHFQITVTGHTQCSQSCRAGLAMASQVGYDMRYSKIPGASTRASANSKWWNWCLEDHRFGSVTNGWADYHKEVWGPFPCTSDETTFAVWYKCWTKDGSWRGGERQAIFQMPALRYRQHTPKAPTSFAVARVSDSSQKLTWTRNCTNMAGHYSWLYLHVERRQNNGSWVQLARLSWNALNYTDNTTKSGQKYDYRVRASNINGEYSPYTAAVTVYTTPNALGSLQISKLSNTVVQLTGKTLWGYRNGYNAQRSVSGGAWANVSVTETSTGVWRDSSVPASGSVKYRVRAWVKQGGSVNAGNYLYGAWKESSSVSTVQAPNAPSVTVDRDLYEASWSAVVSWAINHPDGTAQTAAQVEFSQNGTAKLTKEISGTGKTYTQSLSGWADGTYSVRARTKGLSDSWGAWSGYVTFRVATRPSVTITTPTLDYDGTNAYRKLPITIGWSAYAKDGINRYVLSVADPAGNEVFSKAIAVSGAPTEQDYSYGLTAAAGLSNSKTFTVSVTVKGGSELTRTATRTVHTDWAQPVPPAMTVTFDDDLAGTVTVEAGIDDANYYVDGTALRGPMDEEDSVVTMLGAVSVEGTSLVLDGVLNIESYDLVRIDPEGGREQIGSSVPLGYRLVDPLPPLNVDFDYEVTAYTSLGTASRKTFPAYCDSEGMEAFNFGAAAQHVVKLGLNASDTESVENAGESYYFAMGADTPALPTFYPDGTLASSRSLSYVLHTQAEYESLRRYVRNRDLAHFWYRDYWGHRMYAYGQWQLGYAAQNYSLWNVSVNPTEVVWKGPVNGQ